MTKRAQVGLFTIIAALAIFGVFYVLADIGTRSRGYKIGVHFRSANGLHQAAYVYLSGVPIGAVDQVALQPDYSVDVVMAIKPEYAIPVGSKFLIQAPLTGEPNVLIAPPKNVDANTPTLARELLPIDQQPQGTNPTTFADLIEEGQGEVRRLDNILGQVQAATPDLLRQLQVTLRNASAVSQTANDSLSEISRRALLLTDQLSAELGTSGKNVQTLTDTLAKTTARDSGKVDQLLGQLTRTATSLNVAVDSLRDVATNPEVKENLISTTRSLALTAHTFAELTNDLRKVTADPQTQAQLRDTVAQIDASTQKLDSLLAQLGGQSAVYGIDQGATPPAAGASPGLLPSSSPANGPGSSHSSGVTPASGSTPVPQGAEGTSSHGVTQLHAKLSNFLDNLVTLQFRISQLEPQRPASAERNTSPLLTADRGLQSDFNAIILPNNRTSLVAGVNDLGFASTGNLLLLDHLGQLRYGGGIEYSQLGLYGGIATRPVGFDVRFYDLRHPTLDTYLYLSPGQKLQFFGGGRDLLYTDRRYVFGLQFEL
jgi:ABC-type transporter Mla subunit MlaD